MFRIDRHIEILLLKHDCVILPGFGGFVTHHVSAHLDESDGTMLPPKVMVGFNQQLTINDSLLVQSYVEAYDYSYPEALRIIEDEISQLHDMIQENGYFDIHAIGRLTINKDGFYEFEPISAGILSPTLYGLTGVATNDTELFNTSKVEIEKESSTSYNTDIRKAKDFKIIQISTNSLRHVMVACLVILFIMIFPFMNRNTNSHQLISGIDTSFLSSLIHKANITTNANEINSSNERRLIKQEKETPTATEVEINENKDDVSKSQEDAYTVVLAARITKKNAENYVDDLHKRGINQAKVIGEGKSRKVIYGSYKNKEDAQKIKNELSANDEFSSSWVTKI